MPTQLATRQIRDEAITDGQIADDALFSVVVSIDHTGSPYTILSTDELILVDTSTAVVELLLTDVTAEAPGREIIIKDAGNNATTNNITVTPAGAQTIDGGTSMILTEDGSVTTLMTTSTEWARNDTAGTALVKTVVGSVINLSASVGAMTVVP